MVERSPISSRPSRRTDPGAPDERQNRTACIEGELNFRPAISIPLIARYEDRRQTPPSSWQDRFMDRPERYPCPASRTSSSEQSAGPEKHDPLLAHETTELLFRFNSPASNCCARSSPNPHQSSPQIDRLSTPPWFRTHENPLRSPRGLALAAPRPVERGCNSCHRGRKLTDTSPDILPARTGANTRTLPGQ